MISIYSYRKSFHLKTYSFLLPAATVGIVFGYLWFNLLSEDNIRIFLGLLAIIFSLNYFFFSKDSKMTNVSVTKDLFGEQSLDLRALVFMLEDLAFNIYVLRRN